MPSKDNSKNRFINSYKNPGLLASDSWFGLKIKGCHRADDNLLLFSFRIL